MSWRVGVDTGGTFTDIVGIEAQTGELLLHKVHSTPGDPGRAVVTGILGLAKCGGFGPGDISLVLHGTTVGTNTVLQRGGANVAMVTTAGFRDVLAIGRQNRPALYDLRSRRPQPLAPRARCVEVQERVLYDGEIETPLTDAEINCVVERIKDLGVDAIVVGLLHSYVNPKHELAIGRRLTEALPGVSVVLSHQVVRTQGEFERFSTAVLNAYVQPTMAGYLGGLDEALRRAGVDATLLVMKSNGGVTPASVAARRCVETLLSGPAGGVVAGVTLAERHPRGNIITADVGGTSFDVSVIHNGQPTYTQNTRLGGQAIQLPMIDINTIGAGGGSIAWMDDGGALRVGPRSAGADPGPACYGKGGEHPTVTDANLVLGRIGARSPLGGGILLDVDAARAALSRLAATLSMSIEDLAEGIIRIANANMVSAIRKLTVECGRDPREFSLCVFGGAGPLHGAELAREMGVAETIVPTMPGVFSAFGMLWSQLREEEIHARRGLLRDAVDELDGIFTSIAAEAASRLSISTDADVGSQVTRRLRLRYLGQGHDLTVTLAPGSAQRDAIEQDFHKEHRQMYGYDFAGEPIEMVSAWVSVAIDLPEMKLPSRAAGNTPQPTTTRPVYFDGRLLDTPVYQRETLGAGCNLRGPAIIEQADTTTVVWPEQSLTVDDLGQIVLGPIGSVQPTRSSSDIDPIKLEIMRNRWRGIAEEACAAMIHASFSPNIRERFDCSTALATVDGQIIAQAEVGTPLHLGIMPAVIRAVLDETPAEQMRPGDAIITNLPYPQGPGHLPDLSMVSAVFRDGKPVALVVTTAHHVDMGGYAPGSMPFGVREIYQEGLQIPPTRIIMRGKIDNALFRLIEQNVRTRRELRGDLMAQWAAAQTAQRRIDELFTLEAPHTMFAYMDAILDHAERTMRSAIERLPDGQYTFEDFLDDDGQSDEPVRIAVRLTVRGDELIADFAGTSDQVTGPLNARLPAARAAMYYVAKAVLDPDLPSCSGAHRPITVAAPEGSLLQARFPAAIGNANILTDQRIVDVLLGALHQCVPQRVCAACSGEMNLINIGGVDPRRGEYFNYVETVGGGQGACHDLDGSDGIHTHLTNTQNTPVEVFEQQYPMRLLRYGLIPDSAGAGEYRGGCGIVREYLFLGDQAILSIGADRRRFTPWGLDSGSRARGAHCDLTSADGWQRELPTKVIDVLHLGDRLRIETPGGGGWGHPAKRDPQAIQTDLDNGLVTAESARNCPHPSQ